MASISIGKWHRSILVGNRNESKGLCRGPPVVTTATPSPRFNACGFTLPTGDTAPPLALVTNLLQIRKVGPVAQSDGPDTFAAGICPEDVEEELARDQTQARSATHC